MIEINLMLVVEILTILGIVLGAIGFFVKINNTILKQTIVLDSLVGEVSDLKGYEKRISDNETDIAVIKKTCSLNHREVNYAKQIEK